MISNINNFKTLNNLKRINAVDGICLVDLNDLPLNVTTCYYFNISP